MRESKRCRAVQLGLDVASAFTRCGLAHSAAALAYFMILTLFPLLICVNYFIGLFHLDLEQFLFSLHQVFPQEVLQVVGEYLDYASGSLSPAVLPVALFAILISASAGLRTVMHAMDRLYGRPPRTGPLFLGLSLVLSVLFLLTIYLSVVVIFTGGWFFQLLERRLPPELTTFISLDALSQLWLGLRYLLLFAFMLLLVLILYYVGSPRGCRGWGLILNAALTAAALAGCSALFSWFIGMSSRYSLLYGSLASIIILLVWLYLCGCILLLGAAAGQQVRAGKQ